MADWYKEFSSLGHAVIKKIRLSNAMGAPLALVVLVSLPALTLYGFTRFWPLLIIGAAPALYFMRVFDYLMKNHPNMLRTEEHEERMLQIQTGVMGEKHDQLAEEAVDILTPVTTTTTVAIAPTVQDNSGKEHRQ